MMLGYVVLCSLGLLAGGSLAPGNGSEAGCSFVLLGASGDLARREIYPGLWQLHREGLLPAECRVLGVARRQLSVEQLRERVRPFVEPRGPEEEEEAFWARHEYLAADAGEPEPRALGRRLAASGPRRLFYLALPPASFAGAAAGLARALQRTADPRAGWTRLVVEKPFGRDAASARELSDQLARLFPDEQLYRADHFLAEEMLQALLALRFGNRLLATAWSRESVAAVMLDFREDWGVEARGGYFDENGILRDVVQNHLLQVVALAAMEQPASCHPDDVRDAKVALLRSVRAVSASDLLLGQYVGDPESGEPRARRGYRDEPTVPDDSLTATFALVVLRIDNERWRGVPFIVRAGKGLNTNKTELVVQYKEVDNQLFEQPAARNELIVKIGKIEALQLKLTTKTPGIDNQLDEITFDFDYRQQYEKTNKLSAYARLILDVFRGSQANFVRNDELTEAWRIFTPILHELETNRTRPIPYRFGSTGPDEADEMERQNNFLRKHL